MIPAVALALPAPSILTYNQKQTWIAVWQVFPIWIEISQQILSFVVSRLFSPELHISRTRQSSKLQKIRALRIAYIFAMVVVGVTRIATFSISLTSKMFPAMFAPEYRGILDPSNVFRTAFTSPSNKLSFVGEGAFQLLQHDEICGSVALLVWSATLLVKKYNESQAFNLQAGLKMLAAGIGLIVGVPRPWCLHCVTQCALRFRCANAGTNDRLLLGRVAAQQRSCGRGTNWCSTRTSSTIRNLAESSWYGLKRGFVTLSAAQRYA